MRETPTKNKIQPVENCLLLHYNFNLSGKNSNPVTVCVPCHKYITEGAKIESKIPEHFDDLWRKSNKQGYLRVRKVS